MARPTQPPPDAAGDVPPPRAGDAPRTGRSGRLTLATCAALLLLFAGLSLWGMHHRSATTDEPMHAAAGYVLARYGDFRANPEDPNLWQRWATLAVPRDALKVDFTRPTWRGTFDDDMQRWQWCVDTLYHTPGNDPDAFLWRMRYMLVALGVAVGALVAWWGWQLGGAVAAVVAAALFCLDPNFLAHATQVKNDVALSLVTVALSLAVWRAGRRLTWLNALAVVAATAAGPSTKFSGFALVGVSAILLAARAVVGGPWQAFGRRVGSRLGRLGVAAALSVVAAAGAYALLWAIYDFRFRPSPNPADPPYDTRSLVIATAEREILATHPDVPVTREEMIAWRPGAVVRTFLWAERHRVLPQTWLHGLLQTYAGALTRGSFLCGQYSNVGFALYFPLAFLFKTPVGTILAVAAALTLLVRALAARCRRDGSQSAPPPSAAPTIDAWTALCLLVPAAVYMAAAMRSNLNIGLRHILPIYPALFVLAGWAAAAAYARWGRVAARVAAAVVLATVLETLLVAPDFLTFFNAPSGGPRGGIRLLGDSNLDWGQDLPALADWQKRNPGRRLYVFYFGSAPPAYYGIRYIPMEGSNPLTLGGALTASQMPVEPGVMAISASHLQGIYLPADQRRALEPFRNSQPTEVLNNTIYLFDMAADK